MRARMDGGRTRRVKYILERWSVSNLGGEGEAV